jgi:hypothetical protein
MNQPDTEEIRVENPHALYEEPPADPHFNAETRAGRFRLFAHRNKRIIYAVVLLAIVLGFAAGFRTTPGFESTLESYFNRFHASMPDAAYQVAGAHVDKAHLRAVYESHKRLLGAVDYSAFAQEQFETDLVLRAALDEGMLSSPEASLILESALRRAAADYYLRKKFAAELEQKAVTTGEAKLVYEKTKTAMKELKLSETEAVASIQNTLTAVQAQEIRAKQLFLRRELTNRLKQIYSTKSPELR